MSCRLLLLASLLAGCGCARLRPTGPVLDAEARASLFPVEQVPAGVAYDGDPRAVVPVPPTLPWALALDLDLLLGTQEEAWGLHEVARVTTAAGPRWLALDTRMDTGAQRLVVDGDDGSWLPELPVVRGIGAVRVDDRSGAERVDLDAFYDNGDGDPVHIWYGGPQPRDVSARRNGPTLGHSGDVTMAFADVRAWIRGTSARVTVGGQDPGVRRIVGLVPQRAALVQTLAGLGAGQLSLTPLPPAFDDAPVSQVAATWTRDPVSVDETWQLARTADGVDLVQRSAFRTVRHRFVGHDAWEWVGVEITQRGQPLPTLRVSVSPALPDLRRPFQGEAVSHFVVDVAGQEGSAVGTVRAAWGADGPSVWWEVRAPTWAAARPMRTDVRFERDAVRVHATRVMDR